MTIDDLDNSEQIPGPLASDLRALYTGQARIPGEVDASVLAEAETALRSGRRRSFRLFRWVAGGGAIAASVALFILSRPGPITPEMLHAPVAVASQPADIDDNGIINILDAFTLAQRIEAGRVDRGDVDSNGTIDRRDVDTIAMMAVSIEETAG